MSNNSFVQYIVYFVTPEGFIIFRLIYTDEFIILSRFMCVVFCFCMSKAQLNIYSHMHACVCLIFVCLFLCPVISELLRRQCENCRLNKCSSILGDVLCMYYWHNLTGLLLCRWRGVCLGPQWLQSTGQWDHQPRVDPSPRVHQPAEQESDRSRLWLPSLDRSDNRWRGHSAYAMSVLSASREFGWEVNMYILYPGVRLGVQQLRPSRFRVYRQPADSTPGEQLPAEQSGGEYCLWSTLLYGCPGQWRGNGCHPSVGV